MSAEPRLKNIETSSDRYYDAYLALRTALFHFGRIPSELDADAERGKLLAEVEKQRVINKAVQNTPEYSKMIVTENELNQVIDEIVDQVPEDIELDALLLKNGLTYSGLRDSVALDLRVAAVFNYLAEKQPEVSDVDAELFFHLHSDRFLIPEQRIARHILVTINDDFAENRREQALSRIKKVHKELLKKPFKFEKLAKANSECPTAMEGGLLGVMTQGQLYPEIDAVLFAMAEGEISEVVESPLGFHVLLCEHIQAQRYTPFAEVKEKIKDALRKRNQRVAQRKWLQQITTTAANN